MVKLTRAMKYTIVHDEGAISPEVARTRIRVGAAVIKIGLDVHAHIYVAVVQHDDLLPKASRRLRPAEFVPWVETLLRAFVIQFLDDLLDTCLVTAPRALLLCYAHRGHCKDDRSY